MVLNANGVNAVGLIDAVRGVTPGLTADDDDDRESRLDSAGGAVFETGEP
jgi:hypothetical protein